MLNVCLSFDYELFMQENFASYEEILFTPTALLQTMLNQENTKATFFADVCSALVHQRYGITEYSNTFLEQIQSLSKDGHDIQLHLHPSWYRAIIKGDKLFPSYNGYRLHEYGFNCENLSAIDIINEGVDYLNINLRLINSQYKCIAFRAGGFAVQPERDIFNALIDKGIVIDSSVVPYMKNDLINGYNFTNVPNMINWWINPERGLDNIAEPGPHRIFEVPIATLRPRLFKYIGLSANELHLPSPTLLGSYVSNPMTPIHKTNKLKQLYERLFNYRYVSLDTRYYKRVVEDLLFIFRSYNLSRTDAYICVICHPKLIDQHRIDNIRNLINELRNYPQFFKIVTMRDIYDIIHKSDV